MAQVLFHHAVANKAVAYARDHRRLADLLGQRHHGGQHVGGGLCAAHHFEQLHHIRRAEKMQAHHVLRALRAGRNLVQIQRRGIGRQDGAGLHHPVQLFEYCGLDAHVFKHRLNHQIGLRQVLVLQRGAQQSHALLQRLGLELALADLRLVVAAHGGHAALQRLKLQFQHLHGDTGVQKIHGDAAAHGSRADDGYRRDRAQRSIGGTIRNFGSRALTEKQVAQRPALRRGHQAGKDGLLGGQPGVKSLPRGGLYRVHTLQRRRQILGRRIQHIAHKLKVRIALRVAARQRTHQRQRAYSSHGAGESNGLVQQRIRTGAYALKQTLAGYIRQPLSSYRLATHDHVQGWLDPDDARQPLRAPGTGQQPQLDLGQGHLRTRRGDTVVAAQRQLQPATHGRAVDRGHHRLAGLLQRRNHGMQIRLLKSRRGVELADIGSAAKGFARTGDDDGLHRRIGQRL